MKKLLTLITVFFFIVAQSFAQTSNYRNITGKVTSGSGELLVGAFVFVEGTNRGTSTNELGEYSLSVLPTETITVSLIGYATQTIKVSGRAIIDVTLEENSFLDEIVVVGYGTQKRRDIVGAIEQLSGESLSSRSNPNAVRSIQGQIPGLTLEFQDGKPNHGATMNIRGAAQSIGSGGSCLVLVDGVEAGLDNVIPEDIQSITVLKDASSCAIYGARGAFGVILVTTKAPKAGKVTVNYNGAFSVLSNTVKYEFENDPLYFTDQTLISYEGCYGYSPTTFNNLFPYSVEWHEELKRRYLDSSYEHYGETVGVSKDGLYQYYGNTDWFDLIYKDYTTSTQHDLSVSGGTDKIKFYLSGRFFNQKGIYNTKYENYWKGNFLAKITANIKKWWTLESNTNFYEWHYKQPVLFQIEQSFKGQIEHQGYPMTVPYNPDGSFTDAAVCVGYSALETGLSYQLNEAFKLGENISNTFHIVPGVLDLNLNFAYAYNYSERQRKTNIYDFKNGPDIVSSRASFDSYEELRIDEKYWKTDGYFTYTPNLGKNHTLKFTGGYNVEWKTYHGTAALERGLIREDKPNFSLTEGEYYYIDDYGSYTWAYIGFFSRLAYNYKDRYLAEASARYDGSSKFPENSRWGLFPSVSLGWRFSEEKFLSTAKSWLDNAKIRVSAGSLGNGAVKPYSYLQSMAVTKSSIYVNGKIVQTTKAPSPIPAGLTWEKSATYDVGLDLDFLGNRLSFVGDYYIRKTTDMYTVGKTLPAVFGQTPPKGNYADMETKGWELSLGWRDSFKLGTRDFQYGAKFMLWDSRSFITAYNNENKELTDYYEGMEIGEIWGMHVLGLFVDNEDVINSADQSTFFTQNRRGNKFEPGDIKFEDKNNDGYINYGKNTADDPGDMSIIGNTTPRYCYGINLNASWNGIGLSLFFQGVGQRDWYPSINCGMFYGKYARPYTMIPKIQTGNQWTEENPDPNAFWPKLSSYLCTDTKGTLSKVANDRFLVDASYCRLKNITLDYTFPRSVLDKMKISGLRIYLSGENLFTWSPMKKWTKVFDPEVISSGDTDLNGVYNSQSKADGNSYPMLKSVTLGINLTF